MWDFGLMSERARLDIVAVVRSERWARMSGYDTRGGLLGERFDR